MKITDVKVSVVEVEWVTGGMGKVQGNLVQILTDEGIEGEFIDWRPPHSSTARGLAELTVNILKPMIVGRDPFDRENIWQMLMRRSDMGGLSIFAVGAIDIALWDIAGKAAGMPVYKLLGGYRDKVRAYASIVGFESAQGYYDCAKEMKEMGYTAIKLHLRGTVQDHLEACRAARDAVGDSVDLMLDSHCMYDHREALMVGREAEKLNFYWYEDPLPNTDLEGNKELCQLLDIPIAVSEMLMYHNPNPSHFIPYLTDHITDIVRVDAICGITLAKKVADLCDAFNVKCELHSYGPSTDQFANLHVIGATRNSDFFEKMEPGDLYDVCAKDVVKIDNEGFVHLPSKPGLGLELDFDEIKKRTILTM